MTDDIETKKKNKAERIPTLSKTCNGETSFARTKSIKYNTQKYKVIKTIISLTK
ncbi:hypothetical protein ASZ90_004012 [hydrocarbon metagenome]|uniref:Uncharacterized protein n=1 Tax=hydrocarbon metagenome TaxID=938273 RepID=A0A0W8FYZ7_9ZZZZ